MISACFLTLLRALIIALISTWLAQLVVQGIRFSRAKKRIFYLILCLLPLTVPPLLPAYAYSSFSFNFQTQPILNEILYTALTAAKITPVAVILFLVLPSPVSRSSDFCSSLLKTPTVSPLFKNSHNIVTFYACALLAFHEYEMASLLRIKHWTVVLFNAHAGGLVMNLSGTLKLALVPVITSLTLIAVSFHFLKNCKYKINDPGMDRPKSLPLIISFLLLITLIIPAFIVLSNSLSGFSDALSNSWMLNEFINSLSITAVSTLCCFTLAAGITRVNKTLSLFIVIPGLLGSLVLGIAFIYLFNAPLLNSLKQSVVPLCLALIVYGMPIALLLIFTLKLMLSSSGALADLLPQSSKPGIKWQVVYIPTLLTSIPVFCFLWFDLTLSSMLAPASVTTLFPRLYNLMHYSENEKLSATVMLTVLIPFILYCILFALGRLWFKATSNAALK